MTTTVGQHVDSGGVQCEGFAAVHLEDLTSDLLKGWAHRLPSAPENFLPNDMTVMHTTSSGNGKPGRNEEEGGAVE